MATPQGRPLRVGWLLAAVALLVRGAVCFSSIDSDLSDPDAYRAIAQTLASTGVYGLTAANGETIPTAFRPPLYPFVLSWLVVDGQLPPRSVATLHTLLGVITVLLTYLTARRLLGPSSQAGSILAALVVLVDPILLQQSTQVMTETLATALVILVLWLWSGWMRSLSFGSALLLGLAFALAYLCRPTFLVWSGLLCAGWLMTCVRRSNRGCWQRAVIATAIVVVVTGLWTARNIHMIGHPVWGTTHGGYTLLLANNPSFYDHLQNRAWSQAWDATDFLRAYGFRYDGDPTSEVFWRQNWDGPSAIERGEVVGISERDDDQLAYDAATATIGRQPGLFAFSCLIRVLHLWSPLPHVSAAGTWQVAIAVGIWYGALYVLVVWGTIQVIRTRRWTWSSWWPLVALLFTLTAVHAIYWSNMRMRAPAIPVLAILAAAAIPAKFVGEKTRAEQGDVANR